MATETSHAHSDLAVHAAGLPAALRSTSQGTAGFYLVALSATAVSVDTSYRFFGQVLPVGNMVARGVPSVVLALALVASVVAIRASRHPGMARVAAWALCGLSTGMAMALSGLAEGAARAALGPVLVLMALHLALGTEVRAKRGEGRHRAR